jgi:hypothetical protein
LTQAGVGVLAVAAEGLISFEKRWNYIVKQAGSAPAPLITVEVENSSSQPVAISQRGDLLLQLPRQDGYDSMGKYKFREADRSAFKAGVEMVPPKTKKRFFAHIMDQTTYGRILERGDCDVAFMVLKASGGLRTTGDLPFTKDAIKHRYLTVDIGAD